MSQQRFTKEELRDKLDGNELDLSLCNLSKVPVREIVSLPKATSLDLSCNVLTILPPTFSSLTQLTKLDLSKNNLTELPFDFGHLIHLQRLDLLSNKLKALPTSFIHLKKLRWLDLKGNPIQTLLPDVVGNCLSAEECKQCASSMISYLKREDAEHERKRQQKLEEEREKKALQNANEAKESELRRRQKIIEKQERREAFEAMEKEKKLITQKAEETFKVNGNNDNDKPQRKPEELKKGNTRRKYLLFVIILGFILGIFGLLLYCSDKRNCVTQIKQMWN